MMHDKSILITGASRGIGLAMALELARLGARVITVSRDPERARAAHEQVAGVATGAPPTALRADLSSQAEVRRLALHVRAVTPRLDVLINNAGAAFRDRQLSVDGIERTLATNHLAPFLLTNLLLDLVRASPAGRIVNVTSSSHSRAIDFGNLQLERGYGVMRAYALSKTCNVLFTYELAHRLEGTPITSNCFDPGPTETSFGHTAGGFIGAMMRVLGFVGVLRSAEVAGRTGVYLASSPAAANVTGSYFLHDGRQRKSKPVTYDREAAAHLWTASEALCNGRSVEANPATAARRAVDAATK
jgi:NAD(P)-dependent dehydrogenase (short-subunit alcohol dehydrogenase family)